jgi:two-component system NtrC family sensor kinase
MYAALTHEINNPLGILSARVSLMLATARESGADPAAIHDLEIVERQGGRIAEIMRGLLAFSRKAEFTRSPVDLNTVVREIAGLVEKPYSKQGVLVQTELASSLPTIEGSPEHLHQVLVNLVTNARDAMPEGGTLTLRTRRDSGRVVAEVCDTGRGLSVEAREHLFEPFFTTKGVGQGTGLGLSVSHGIVSAHGGQIEAFNAVAGGAVFRIVFPMAGAQP